jgi:hypothetical protein
MSSVPDPQKQDSATSFDSKDSKSTTPAPNSTSHTPHNSVASSTTSDETLTCRWHACNEKSNTAELLYVNLIPDAALHPTTGTKH